MNAINDVTPDQITALKDIQAARLLLKLLTLEAERNHQPLSGVSVPLNITVADGGEDARVEWQINPPILDWIPNKYTMFQMKATYMGIEDCGEEILKRENGNSRVTLKAKVHEVFNKSGCYILFYTKQALVKEQIDERIESIRRGITEAAEANGTTAEIRIYDSNLIANWTNTFPQAVTYVDECLGITKPIPLETWNEWADRKEYYLPFIKNRRIEEYLKDIKEALARPKGVLRLVGLSGLGKTRLGLEALRPPDDGISGGKALASEELNQKILSDSVIYYDAVSSPTNLRDYVVELASHGAKGILVIDNCDIEAHHIIANEIKQRNKCQLSFLSIDSNPENVAEDQTYYIHLKPKELEDIIPDLLKKVISGISDRDIERIQEFAQGFPLIAVLLARDREAKIATLGKLNDTELVRKLLGTDVDDEDLNVIRACAIFESLGFEAELSDQRNAVATSDLISKLAGTDDTKKNKFFEVGKRFIDRGIIERKGRTISVRPRPLALRLAADWWKNCRPESVPEILTELIKAGLAEALCDQMAFLDFLPEAREITKNLCGDQGPFGQAKVLDTELGSRLFRSLVEVNPEACSDAISQAFSSYSMEELKQVGPGRRNIVWALEKLCFWESTFAKAARSMMAFAAAENESWDNNATNQFYQLFHTYLSGTQASPSERLSIVDEALTSQEKEYKQLAVQALGHALQTHSFTRTGGVEKQGSKMPQREWTPKIWGDAFIYWHEALGRLVPLALTDDEIGEIARGQIARSIRGLVSFGRMDDVENALRTIVTSRGPFWPKALESVRQAIQFEGPKIPEDGLKRLRSWETMLQAKNIPDRIRQLVSVPSWHDLKEAQGGKYIDLAEQEAAEFAAELVESPDPLFENLPLLYEGEQRKGFIFGFTLGERGLEPRRFINDSLQILSSIDFSKSNSDVLAGFLRAIMQHAPTLVSETFDRIVREGKLLIHSVNIARSVPLDYSDFLKLIALAKDRRIELRSLRALSYGRPLSHLKPEEVTSFCDQLLDLGVEGAACALDILHMYTFRDTELIEACYSEFRKIMLTPDLLNVVNSPNQMDIYHWEEVAKSLLKRDVKDMEFAIALSKIIVHLCEQETSVFDLRDAIGDVMEILLSDFLNETWSIFADALLSEGSWVHHNVVSLIEGRSGISDEKPGVISKLSPDFLLAWTKTNQDKAPELLARITPLFSHDNNQLSWHPLAQGLIDMYGHRKDVLSALFINLISFGGWGSMIPEYEERISALKILENHHFADVRNWAARSIETLKSEIENERRREEERGF